LLFSGVQVNPGPAQPYIATTGSAYQAPRFDHDPTTLAPRGLLLESSTTNLLEYSEDFNAAAWTDTSITRATGNADPAGGTTAVRFTASSGNATVIRAAAIGTTASRTFSIFLRRVTGTGNIDYTLDNGSTYTTQAITGSWVRYTFTATSANHQVGIRIVTSGDAIEMWGAQLETGSGASSYIPTGAGTVQRAADVCYMDTPAVNPWFVKNNEATFQIRYECDNLLCAGTNVMYLGQWSGGAEYSFGFQHYTFAGSGGTLSGQFKTVASPSSDRVVYQNQSLPGVFNTALAFSQSASIQARSFNGNATVQYTTTTWPTWSSAIVRLGIGTNTLSSHGYVRVLSLKYWPFRFDNTALQNLTL
jgi:hypothetical protein